VFDALLSERPYKPAWSLDRALSLISDESGRHFDPDCVEAMLLNLDRILSSRKLDAGSSEPQTG
jgi:HD-GYP domain-containing protein (c-di-GMP phosphodiesterase class II)